MQREIDSETERSRKRQNGAEGHTEPETEGERHIEG